MLRFNEQHPNHLLSLKSSIHNDGLLNTITKVRWVLKIDSKSLKSYPDSAKHLISSFYMVRQRPKLLKKLNLASKYNG